jgi:hypothetical protein
MKSNGCVPDVTPRPGGRDRATADNLAHFVGLPGERPDLGPRIPGIEPHYLDVLGTDQRLQRCVAASPMDLSAAAGNTNNSLRLSWFGGRRSPNAIVTSAPVMSLQ